MFEIRVVHSFPAGHFLRNYVGKCANPHGHNYRVEVAIAAESLDERGLLMDFSDLKRELRGLCERLDHQMLNEIPPFDKRNPSAENIALYFCEELSHCLPRERGIAIREVRVWETDAACAVYRP
jgi:6-pyruvoyltetrahydropterin/6-carboxytetrahydropterin synthase